MSQRKPGCVATVFISSLKLMAVLLLFGFVATFFTSTDSRSEQTSGSLSTPRPTATPRPTPTATATPDPAVVRQSLIKSGFSFWDGSHIALTRAIKDAMHNPKSYEHVDTTYIDRGDYLEVTTVYRGTNTFGGIVKDSVTAHVNLDGSIIAIVEQSP